MHQHFSTFDHLSSVAFLVELVPKTGSFPQQELYIILDENLTQKYPFSVMYMYWYLYCFLQYFQNFSQLLFGLEVN